jgi:hypothetical protein
MTQMPVRVARQSQVSAANYYRRWVVQVVRQTLKFGVEQAVALTIAIAILILQVLSHDLRAADFRTNELDTLWPYLAVVVVYILVQIVRAPLVLDRQRALRIQDLDDQIVKRPEVTFEKIDFYNPTPNSGDLKIFLRMSIRTGESPATLSGWALSSKMKTELKPMAVEVIGLDKHLGGLNTRLESHDSASGYISFAFMGLAQASENDIRDIRHGWTLQFSDAHHEYAEQIPEHLYEKS